MNIAIYSGQDNFSRLVTTILTRLSPHETTYTVVPCDGSAEVDVAIVDASDAAALAQANAAARAGHDTQLIHIVNTGGQAKTGIEVLRSQIVVGLIPVLQALASEMATARAIDEAPATTTPPQIRVFRALVVDDSATARAKLQNTLFRLGMECEVASCADAALKRIESASFDIVYVDAVMPGIDGYQLTRLLKKHGLVKKVPIVLLTNQGSAIERARGLLAGCDAWVAKPIDPQQFHDVTVKLLSKSVGQALAESPLVNPAHALAAPATLDAPGESTP